MPKVLSRKPVSTSRLFTIEQIDLAFDQDKHRTFERVCGVGYGSVMIVPVCADGRFILIREYAAGIDQYVLSFPRGGVDQNESFLQAADREIKEEISCGANQLTHIMSFSASPGYFNSHTQLILAEDLYPCAMPGDEPEPLEVSKWSLSQVDTLLAHSEFIDARSMAALLWLERRQRAHAAS